MSFDPGSLFASMIVSGAGFVSFAYGKRQRRVPQIVIGIIMMVFPYFVPDVIAMVAIGAGLLGLLWLIVRLGY